MSNNISFEPLNLFGETAFDFYSSAVNKVYDAINSQTRKLAGVYALCSGGNDSVAVSFVAAHHPAFKGVIHCNTGIGVEETRQYVRNLCSSEGWPLHELHPPDLTYEAMIRRYGFPGPASHGFSYIWLKERALQKFIPTVKNKGEYVVLVTGVRYGESRRRMGKSKPVKMDDRGRLWVAPLINWSPELTRSYRQTFGIPPNPVADKLCMSGECKCGAYAAPGEREETAMWFPDVELEIERLEHLASKSGVHALWGVEPPLSMRRYPNMPVLDEQMCVDCGHKEEAVV